MEEMRQAAIAYYNNLTPELQSHAHTFFRSMDSNADGHINFNEFVHFLMRSGYHWIHPYMFLELDRNRDGALDFYEVLTFYYIVKTKNVWCRVCRTWLRGLYFTCVTCFDGAVDTFDLCIRCYQDRPTTHYHNHHDCFLDNYTLLHCRRSVSPHRPHHELAPEENMQVITAQPQQGEASSGRVGWIEALQALDVGITMAFIATTVGCSIM